MYVSALDQIKSRCFFGKHRGSIRYSIFLSHSLFGGTICHAISADRKLEKKLLFIFFYRPFLLHMMSFETFITQMTTTMMMISFLSSFALLPMSLNIDPTFFLPHPSFLYFFNTEARRKIKNTVYFSRCFLLLNIYKIF